MSVLICYHRICEPLILILINQDAFLPGQRMVVRETFLALWSGAHPYTA